MTIRNILCTYNGSNTSVSSLKYAIRVTQYHEGWLTGIVRHGRPEIETRFGGQLPRDVIETLHQQDAERIKEVSDSFQGEVTSAGLQDRSEFVELEDVADVALSEFSRSFDLIVTGVPEKDMTATHLAAHPDVIALRSGRPVVIVPDGYVTEGIADHAIVAWDGKRSAARAVGDAMSVLEDKPRVTILCVGKSAPDGTDRLITNLKRHGINAELELRPKDHSIGKSIIGAAEDLGAKLIVMGAYEHSKFSHDLFGGVTTDVIDATKVPVFMSH